MRQAQEDTRAAIESMMQHSYAGVNESELEGIFDFALMKRNVRQHAFPSIVAGGARATTLHYVQNDQQVNDGELVLIDLGSACGNYCADISRTFPVNGKFTQRQKELYNTVLNAQQIVIDNCKPGKTLAELNQLVIDYYESRLDDLGLRKDGKTVRDYYYHSVSHQLGLDTHDICTERERTLRPGMVITVEPGLYVEEEAIGIRIENDVCITEDGCEDLSHNIPKTVEEIEALMAK
jgi:Xaa-Pro aminopeptidase